MNDLAAMEDDLAMESDYLDYVQNVKFLSFYKRQSSWRDQINDIDSELMCILRLDKVFIDKKTISSTQKEPMEIKTKVIPSVIYHKIHTDEDGM